MVNIHDYALKILADSGCDCYTYGGENSKYILEDLKKAFPNGMDYSYIDVANAILEHSKPRLIKKSPYQVVWETDNCTDGLDCETLEEAICVAEDILTNWGIEEIQNWNIVNQRLNPTDVEIENWDYMIYNYGVNIYKYNPDTDNYEECEGVFTQDFYRNIGWVEWKEYKQLYLSSSK